jgi:hypothetical protein
MGTIRVAAVQASSSGLEPVDIDEALRYAVSLSEGETLE